MIKSKKSILVILVLCVTTLIWFLFTKTNDFTIVINAQTSPGTVYQNVLSWNAALNKSNMNTVFRKKIPFKKLMHTYNFEGHTLEFDWTIDKINDSITKVSIGINDLERPLMTRIEKLLGVSSVEKLIHKEFTSFNIELLALLDQFNVVVDGQEESPDTFVAYTNVSCHQDKKVSNMISNSININTFLKDNNILLISNPFVEILDWNKNTGQLDFNFCFPISAVDSFPLHKEIKYKKVHAKKSLKATFKGNYSYIDNAWYTLNQYTIDKKIKPLKTIIEVYHNNPHTDVKDRNWSAAVYMEIE